jgi:ABC-2 type transport system permease protein
MNNTIHAKLARLFHLKIEIAISIWLIFFGLILWVFNGKYNIPSAGFASLYFFFELAPILLAIIVPFIVINVDRTDTVFHRFKNAWLWLAAAIIPTIIYVISIVVMSADGIDFGETVCGYIGLLFVAGIFSAACLFCSSLIKNKTTAYIIGVLMNAFLYYGFELTALIIKIKSLQIGISRISIYSHYSSLIRGAVNDADIIYFISAILLFLLFDTLYNKRGKTGQFTRTGWALVALFIIINILSELYTWQWDATSDKRNTLTPQTCKLIGDLKHPLEIDLYLSGKLSPSFAHLRKSTIDIFHVMSRYEQYGIRLKDMKHPISVKDSDQMMLLANKGIRGVQMNETDAKGHVTSQELVFPEADIIYKGDTIPVNLMSKNGNTQSGDMLNVSESNLEYDFVEALRMLTDKSPQRIAFIYGQDEFSDAYVYDAKSQLSKYFKIDHCTLSGNPNELSPYKVLVIAGPVKAFSEKNKYTLDQYLMQGGSILWLADGVKVDEDLFQSEGEAPTAKNNLNIDDMLSTYGACINPTVIQDARCTQIKLAAQTIENSYQYINRPWYFAPLLQPNDNNMITKNISPLKSELVSNISLFGRKGVQATKLLGTSNESHVMNIPDSVGLGYAEMTASKQYFNQGSQTVAVLLEGHFKSAFTNKENPDSCVSLASGRLNNSKFARQIIVSTASIIQNEWSEGGEESQPIPLGYDQIAEQQLGNADFIVNAVNYLAGNDNLLQLHSRMNRLRVLDENVTEGNKLIKWQIINIFGPLALMLLIFIAYHCKKNSYFTQKNKNYT